jgi:hypothetical protein
MAISLHALTSLLRLPRPTGNSVNAIALSIVKSAMTSAFAKNYNDDRARDISAPGGRIQITSLR